MRRLIPIALVMLCASCDHGHYGWAHDHDAQLREAKTLIADNCGPFHRVSGDHSCRECDAGNGL
jgi:hypothetical protein